MLKPGQIIKELKSKSGYDITLRLINKDDAKGILRMWNSIVREDDFIMDIKPDTLKSEIKWVEEEITKLKKHQKIQLIAIYNNKIIGQCALQKAKGRKTHVAKYGLSIMDGFRSQSIGTILSEETIKLAKKYLGIKLIKLSLMEDNKRALRLYKKLGFKKVGIIPGAVLKKGRYIGQLYMYKEL